MANVTPLDNDALLGLFDNYLSKGGGIKILPPPIENPEAQKQLRAIAQEISYRSKLVQGNFMAFERATLVQRAAERPDFILELGSISLTTAPRRAADGSVSHLYRITYAASIRSRTGAEDAPVYPVQTIFKNPEEYGLVSAAGVREIDEADAFFTLSRNGIINLAKRVREGIPANLSGASVTKDGVVLSGGSIDWRGAPPPPFTPLTWLRPGGGGQRPGRELPGSSLSTPATSAGLHEPQYGQRREARARGCPQIYRDRNGRKANRLDEARRS